jgi:signal transduction histidine kinase
MRRSDPGLAVNTRSAVDAGALEVPLWRALTVFRLATLAYAATLVGWNWQQYAHPLAAWFVLAGMIAWTGVAIYGYARPRWRRWPLLAADLVVVLAALLASRVIVGLDQFDRGIATIPVTWHAAPVLAWAVYGGRRLGLTAAVLVACCDLFVRQPNGVSALTGAVLLLMAAATVGHVARLALDAQKRLQRAVELEVATRERDRLARGIHDSVLQVLSLVQRRGAELGGEAAELGRLAGEQEAALRTLVTTGPVPRDGGPVDLRAELGRFAGTGVTLATPADPVPLPAPQADAVVAAVGAALDNVRRHAGADARVWLLLEQERDAVTVSVRDDGSGFVAERLDRAAAEGRLGVIQSIRGRVEDLGGAVLITSAPGEGTEIELRIPIYRDVG